MNGAPEAPPKAPLVELRERARAELRVRRYQMAIGNALRRTNFYGGTVPYEEIRRRRAVGRRAKAARKLSRGNR